MSTKPSLLVFGNCQAEHLAQIARQLPAVAARFQIKVIAPHTIVETDWDTRFDPAFFADVRVVWNQIESGEATFHRRMLNDRLPSGCQIVTFPPLVLLCVWPFSGSDPRIAEAKDYVYPWPDSIAASLAPSVTGENPPDDVLFAEYMRLSTARMPDLDRRLRLDAMRARAADALADIKIWDWVETRFRTEKLFHTSTHLTALPFAYLMPRLLALTGDLAPHQVAAAQRDAAFLLRGHHGQDIETVPVHPLVAERLGLTWFDPDARYNWRAHAWTFREYILKYIRWEPFMH